ncbi:hypothetical protein [Ruminococcus flavefaciens]|uniref:hypothetical protein n=1 Tax=Ruminococcus flavefaciens TaxID=1265 RepID=UPI0002EF50CA|nr:hypothetical protein [Ruminococcus flavefaciens]
MNIAIAQKRLGQVLRIDSIDSTDSDFLATHVPFRKIVVNTRSGNQFEESNRSEEDIYKDIFDNSANREQHQFVIVEGSSGAGKSHFIRWLYANLINREDDNDIVLLIRRSDNTLKGTIRQLLDIKEVKEIANKEAYERLVRANQAITEAKFKSTIYHRFIVEIENDLSERLSSIKRKKLIALLNNSIFQDRLMSAGGPIERIYSKITSTSTNVDLDLIAQFTPKDWTLDVDFLYQLDEADKKAQDFAKSLLEGGEDTEFIQKITDYMNSFVETVIQSSAGIEPGDFEQIFKEIRRELKRKGKGLILLVEDITSFTGINQALLNALVTGHTGSNASDNLCRLISVLGTTSEYYRQFRDNYRDRITKQITIHDGAIGENINDLIQFVAKYLNAISLEPEILDEWVKNGAYSDEMPVYEDKTHDYWDSFTLASKKKISLFPFTKNAIINLYFAMTSQKTPRYILRDIVEPAINEVIYDITSFPRFCIGWRSLISETIENRIGNIVSSLKISEDVKADYRKRLVAFISFWTNKTLDVTDDGCIGGVKTIAFMELAFDDFVGQLTSTATIKSSVKSPTEIIATEVPISSIINDSPIKSTVVKKSHIDDKSQKEYNSFKENVIAWHRDGSNLIRFVQIRNEISSFVYDSINWQQEGVPLDSKKLFMDSIGGRLVGFERQDQAIDKCIIIFPDTDETYQLLLCFGKWMYLGKKSWDFPDAASAVYFATSWLERNKDKFVNVIRSIEKNAIPSYVKAAMIEQVYKKALNGTIDGIKLNRLGDETFLSKETTKNALASFAKGHSSSWYELNNFIFNDPKNDDSYYSSIRYFNLIQGNQVNSSNYVLNYPLYQNAVKEIRKSDCIVDESELNETDGVVKDKREIFELTLKILSKINKVVEEETVLAKNTAMEVLEYFDNIDIEDELEASDIRSMLSDISDFYQKAYEAGINIGIIPKEQIDRLKNDAPLIANAMEKLQMDYSCEQDITVLIAFSSNPVGVVLPFLELLKKAAYDVNNANEMMLNEKEMLTRKGNWNDSVDPRFVERRDGFETLYAAFEEV